MPDSFIKYRSGYKYQLDEDYKIQINIKPQKGVDEKFIKLDQVGNLIVVAGYAWDGPSGPVIDTKENMYRGWGVQFHSPCLLLGIKSGR